MPPERGGVPNLFARYELVTLAPKPDLRQLAKVPAIAYDAVIPR